MGTGRNFRHRISVFSKIPKLSARRGMYLGVGTLALAGALGIGLASLSYLPAASQQAATKAQPPSQATRTQPPAHYREVVDTYCIGCHNGQLKTAGLELDKAN